MNLRESNLSLTKQALKDGFTKDQLIIHTIHTLEELTTIINKLTANLAERYGVYAPRIVREANQEKIIQSVFHEEKDDLGVHLDKEDLDSLKLIAEEIHTLKKLFEKQETYLTTLMKEVCPRLQALATTLIGAKLIDHAKSLKHLAELPSSTIQVLGAEKALFRHLKTGSKPPKFGVIFAHPSITESQERGKAARQLAGKISIAVKQDYFK